MTVLVDAARWSWRDRRWAHLVSDESLDELHELARRLGKRRLGFQGDHYDVDEIDRIRALDLGAVSVDSHDLVRRLRASGLRHRHPRPTWRRLATSEPGVSVASVVTALGEQGPPGHRLVRAVQSVGPVATELAVAAFGDAVRIVVLVEVAADGPSVEVGTADVDELVVGEPRHDGERSIELFVDR